MRIIYIEVDSLRPDHLGCYGYGRDTSPNIDRIAAGGTIFTGAYCNSSPCVPARATFITGRFGINHGAITHEGPASEVVFPGARHKYWSDMPILTRYLRQHGYRTVSFSSFADRHQKFWYAAGWSELHTHTLKQGSENADEVNAAAIPWLRANGGADDYFLHLQYWDPHRAYTVGRRWIDQMASYPAPSWPDADTIDQQQSDAGPFTASELYPYGTGRPSVDTMPLQIADRGDFEHLVNGYDGAIRFLDEQLGEVFDVLDDLGVLDETAFIITADHGEALGEQGIYADHACASEAVHNIPMIFVWPGAGPGGHRYDGLMYNVDLHPTLSDLLDLPVPSRWDGTSVAAAVRGAEWKGRSHLVWDHALYSCQRVTRTPGWLYTRTLHPGLYDFPSEALYAMDSDPRQTTDVADEHPEIVAALDHDMSEWLHSNLSRHGVAADPMGTVVRSGPFSYLGPEQWIPRLRAHDREADVTRLLHRLDLDEGLRTRSGHAVV